MILYAFVKSKNIPITCIPLSIASYILVLSRKDWVAVSVDFFTLKPFWASINMLLFVLKILTYYTLLFPLFFKKPIEVILVYNSVHREYPLFYKKVLL
jgi:hypothetical protein